MYHGKTIKAVIILSVLAGVFVLSGCTLQANPPVNGAIANQSAGANTNEQVVSMNEAASNTALAVKDFVAPISNAISRITKKPFGLYVTPKNSPVQPEKFSGYHTGVDFETMLDESNTDVRITAACEGSVRVRHWVNGYGGVLIQDCTIGGQTVTVLYGHLNISTITVKVGDKLQQGDFIGNLGKGGSPETDGERKHLHLGIHIGATVDYKGYVSTQDQLSAWLDAEKLL